MTSRGFFLLALCSGGLAACGSSGGTPDGGLTATAACVFQKVTLAGDLDGQPVDVQVDVTSSTWQQGSLPYTLDTGYADGMLHLEWTNLVPISAPALAATGTIVMPGGAPHAGETICAGKGSIRDVDPDGTRAHDNYVFVLATLSSGTSCPGAALAGGISGCVGN